jgi:hypothetical protein
MDSIVKQYKAIGLLALEVSIIAQFYILMYAIPLALSSQTSMSLIIKFIIFILSSTTLYLIVAKGPIYWFEKFGWKLFNRKINFHGQWNYEHCCFPPSNYEHFTKKGKDEINGLIEKLKDNHGQVIIEQNVFGISVQEGAGCLGKDQSAPIATWSVNSASFGTNGTFVIQFTSKLGGTTFNGIDTLIVQKRHKGKPVEMKGETLLRPENKDYVLIGQITYKRIL